MCRPKHVEQLRNTGIINPTTQLHLVGSFYEIYIASAWIHEHEAEAIFFLCEVRTEVLNITQIKCMLQRLIPINNAIFHDGAKDLNL